VSPSSGRSPILTRYFITQHLPNTLPAAVQPRPRRPLLLSPTFLKLLRLQKHHHVVHSDLLSSAHSLSPSRWLQCSTSSQSRLPYYLRRSPQFAICNLLAFNPCLIKPPPFSTCIIFFCTTLIRGASSSSLAHPRYGCLFTFDHTSTCPLPALRSKPRSSRTCYPEKAVD
jgi:hypothetical protein